MNFLENLGGTVGRFGPTVSSFGCEPMPTYFKPLRRRIGVVTLVVACVFAAGWVRSLDRGDFLSSQLGLSCSIAGGLFHEFTTGATNPNSLFRYHSAVMDDWIIDPYRNPKWEHKWKWQLLGFGFSEYKYMALMKTGDMGRVDLAFYRIPYWSMVIPLALVSAYLLLSKPRAGKPPVLAPPE